MGDKGFGYEAADAKLREIEQRRYEAEQQSIEDRQNAFDEWAEQQARIPGSGVYRY